jgi:hypothetical protein
MRRLSFWGRALLEGGRWLYGVLGLVLFVTALLALLGVVVVVSVRGPAWLIVLVVALIVLAALAQGTFKIWQEVDSKLARQSSTDLADELLYRKCQVTGAGIQVLVNQRADAVPTLPPDKQIMLAEGTLPRAEELDYRIAVVQHAHDTEWQYKREFAADVFKLVAELRRRGYVAESDLEWLNFPTDVEGIKRIGDRLWEFGRRVKPEHWK